MPRLSDEDYNNIIELLLLPLTVPVKARTDSQRKLFKKISHHKLSTCLCHDPYIKENRQRLMKNDKIVLPVTEIDACIKYYYAESKGEGARKLVNRLQESYYGIGEKCIQMVLNGMEEQQRKRPKFLNKAPLKPINEEKKNIRHQIDLVDFKRMNDGDMKYVLSIIDVHSRFLWLRALPDKKAQTVAEEVDKIYQEWGKPKLIQCDQGL